MKKIILLFLFIACALGYSNSQSLSATDSVIVTTTNNVVNYGRGFDFTPSVTIDIDSIGKRVPGGVNYAWKIWEVNSQTLIHSQTSTSTTPGIYTYEAISSPVTLTAGVRYALILYGGSDGEYFYGSSSQVNSNLTYHEMRYCNNCFSTQPFPTSLLSNMHYGTPDFKFTLCSAAPSISCPANISVNNEQGNCDSEVTFTPPSDPCATSIVQIAGLTSGSEFPVGTTTNTFEATNSFGTSTCSFTIEVIDNENPTITAPSAVAVNTDASSCEATGVALGSPITADNCSVNSVTNDAPTSFPIGSTTVTWTVTDDAGNTATATQTVTVTDDENPTITAPGAVSVSTDASSCEATGVALGSPVTADNCSVNSVTNDAPASFPTGTTTVTWTVTDDAGNSATATQTVTVADDENPTISAPSAVTVSADASSCEATGVALGSPTAADNCSVNSVTNDAPAAFPAGTTTVTWTVTDDAGNSATATQTVTVTDDEAPVISDCPANISTVANTSDCEAIVSWTAPTATDNCTVTLSETISHNPGDVFSLGTTNVSYQYQDDAGNSSTCSFSVEVINDLAVSLDGSDALCNNAASGEVTTTVSGGDGNYSFDWSDGSGFTSNDQNLQNISAGTYNLVVTDDNGCSASEQVTINEPTAIDITTNGTTNPSNCGDNNGGVDLSVNGGTVASDYSYSWSGTGGYSSSAQNPTNFTAGSFTVTVTDDNNCQSTETISLSDPNGPSVSVDVNSSILEVDCYGDSAAVINVDVTLNGGATSAAYSWSDTTTFSSTDQNINGLPAGEYTLTVTDDNNCTESIVQQITQPDSIALVATVVDLLCFGDEDGAIDLTANGGTGDLAFEWNGPNSFNSTDQNITDLESGAYTVEAEDENGCTNTLLVNVVAPSEIDASATSNDIVMGNDGTVDLTVSGGTPNYTFAWDGPGGFNSTDQNLTDLDTPGLYTVTITDENGCEYVLEIFVESRVGLDQTDVNLINVYPNPNNGAFTVDFGGVKEQVTIQVIDAQGRIVKEQTFNNTQNAEMNLDVRKGVYTLHLNIGGLLVNKKIALK